MFLELYLAKVINWRQVIYISSKPISTSGGVQFCPLHRYDPLNIFTGFFSQQPHQLVKFGWWTSYSGAWMHILLKKLIFPKLPYQHVGTLVFFPMNMTILLGTKLVHKFGIKCLKFWFNIFTKSLGKHRSKIFSKNCVEIWLKIWHILS